MNISGNYEEITATLRLVYEMRVAQETFFKNRSQANLQRAKRLEIMVDSELQRLGLKEQLALF